ncbi:unnamed protein product, partial [Brenthis ino]
MAGTKGANSARKSIKKKFTDFKCTICKKTFSEKAGLTQHNLTHSSEKPFTCHLCPHTFKTKKYLGRHIKRVHNEATENECSFCGRKFHFKSLLRQHMYTHTDERPFKCKICGKGFNSSYTLNTHKYIHADAKPFKCEFCDYACRDTSTLRKHHERHMGMKKRYQCRLCEKSYNTKSLLKMHVTEVHLDIHVKNTRCEECGKMFKSNTALNVHIKIVHKKIYACKCEVCGVTISNKYNLATHLTKHVDFKPFRCNFDGCTKRFKEKGTLKKHILVHYPEKQFECKICNKKFTRVTRLNLHKKQHRLKTKCVTCDYCGTSFYNKNYLMSHIKKKHLLKQAYACDACGFCTYNKPSLVMHIKSGHDSELDRQCKICNKTYKKHIYLKLHYWKCHCVRYNMTVRQPKPKKREIIIKEEPSEYTEIEMLHEVKIEPKSDSEAELSTDNIKDVSNDSSKRAGNKAPNNFDDFYIKQIIRPGSTIVKEKDNNIKIDIKCQKEANECLKKMICDKRLKREMRELEKTRREYNRRLKRVGLRKFNTKIKFIKNNIINKNSVMTESNLNDEDNDVISSNNFPNDKSHYENNETNSNINEKNDKNQKTDDITQNDNALDLNNTLKYIDDGNVEINSINENDDKSHENLVEIKKTNETNENENNDVNNINERNNKNKQDSKLKLNMHQCYVCFKLYETRDQLIGHCHQHFDVCNTDLLKKCPLCDFVTKLNLKRHMLSIHKIKVKTQGTLKNDEGTFYYDMKNKIDNIQVIPSVKILNKHAYEKLDRNKREDKKRGLIKKKLVKKNGEWVIENEFDTRIDRFLLPKTVLQGVGPIKIDTDDHVGRLKILYRLAKRNGREIVFPCDKCEKICQTLSALKLHTRKHEENPKPFKKKVWKHKLGEHEKEVKKKKQIGKNRYEDPKPIVSKHKCDDELMEFYKKNIKGGDIEFWQFLKIFNKMSRDNVNDFSDLENRSEFGIHFPVRNEMEKKEMKTRKMKTNTNFKRRILISKKEHEKRKMIIDNLRKQNLELN